MFLSFFEVVLRLRANVDLVWNDRGKLFVGGLALDMDLGEAIQIFRDPLSEFSLRRSMVVFLQARVFEKRSRGMF